MALEPQLSWGGPPNLRPYVVECDPLLCVRVWARDEEDAKRRACDQLANSDFSAATTCSEVYSAVQDVHLDPS